MYRLYHTLQRGIQHPLGCEDALFTQQLSDALWVAAVCDGCSSGKESHFAATLQCKLLRKIVNSNTDLPLSASPDVLGIYLLQQFMEQLAESQMILCLSNLELLATMILLVRQGDTAWVSVLGDGVLNLNGEIIDIEQNNTPDYPAYHLSESDTEWATYFKKQSYYITNLHQIAIATDGVLSFAGGNQGMTARQATEYLLCDTNLAAHNGMLARKCAILHHQHRLLPTDDIAIVRLDRQ